MNGYFAAQKNLAVGIQEDAVALEKTTRRLEETLKRSNEAIRQARANRYAEQQPDFIGPLSRDEVSRRADLSATERIRQAQIRAADDRASAQEGFVGPLSRDASSERARSEREAAARQSREDADLLRRSRLQGDGLSAGDFGRGRSRYGRYRDQVNDPQGLEALAEAEKLKRTMGQIAKVGFGVAIFAEVADRLGKIPQEAEKFREGLKLGYSKTELFAQAAQDNIPLLGKIGNGLRDFASWVILPQSFYDARKKEREQEQLRKEADDRDTTLKRRAAEDEPKVKAAREAALQADERASLARLKGAEREQAANEIAYKQRQRELDEAEKAARGLNRGDSQEQAMAAVRSQRQSADVEFRAQRDAIRGGQVEQAAEQQRAADDQLKKERQSHWQEMQQLDSEQQQQALRNSGRYLDAQLKQLTDSAAAQKVAEEQALAERLSDIEQARTKETEGLTEDDFLRREAERRANQAIADARQQSAERLVAIDAEQKMQADQLRRDDERQQKDTERSHASQLIEIYNDTYARRLRLSGKVREAEKVEAQSAHDQRVRELKIQMEEELRLRAEHAEEIRRRYGDMEKAINEEFATSEQERERNFRKRFESLPGLRDGETRGLMGITGMPTPADKNAEQTAKNTAEIAKQLRDMRRDNSGGGLLAW